MDWICAIVSLAAAAAGLVAATAALGASVVDLVRAVLESAGKNDDR